MTETLKPLIDGTMTWRDIILEVMRGTELDTRIWSENCREALTDEIMSALRRSARPWPLEGEPAEINEKRFIRNNPRAILAAFARVYPKDAIIAAVNDAYEYNEIVKEFPDMKGASDG